MILTDNVCNIISADWAQETPYGTCNCLLRFPDIPTRHLCIVALNPRYLHLAFHILQQKTIIFSLIIANNSLIVYLSFDRLKHVWCHRKNLCKQWLKLLHLHSWTQSFHLSLGLLPASHNFVCFPAYFFHQLSIILTADTVQAIRNITLISQKRTKTKSCEFIQTFSKISEFTN